MAASDCTWLLVLLVKPKVPSGAPVVRLRLATFCLVTPLTALKEPPTKSFVPSGLASTARTPPLNVGRKLVSMSPVSRLYDARPAWLIVVVGAMVFAMEVKLPAMNTRLSDGTTSMSQISPLLMRGVLVRGRSGTRRSWPGTGWEPAPPPTVGLAVRVAGADSRPWSSVTTRVIVVAPPLV